VVNLLLLGALTTLARPGHVRAIYRDPATGRDVEVADDVSFAAYLAASREDSIPFRVVPWWPQRAAAGTGASFAAAGALLVGMAVAGHLLLYRANVRGAREWYECPILEELGSGRLVV
jgi:hypothetical protein